mmetsp:Transcript_7969/g.17732  ORF Transcript_7969/g.17732 Transcript_7969/m.17732 type:complete len:234 (-) Transcript_7969:84-785(-)
MGVSRRLCLPWLVLVLLRHADGVQVTAGEYAPSPAPLPPKVLFSRADGAPAAPASAPSAAAAPEEPFVVSFRVVVDDGKESLSKAHELASAINTPQSPAAKLMPASVARAEGGDFPAPDLNGLSPPCAQAANAISNATLQEEASLSALSRRAAQLAEDNAKALHQLRRNLRAAHTAGQQAFNHNIPPPPPTTAKPLTLGYLVYEALVNTPAPFLMPIPAFQPVTMAPVAASPC